MYENLSKRYFIEPTKSYYICPKCFRNISVNMWHDVEVNIERNEHLGDKYIQDIDQASVSMAESTIKLHCDRCDATMFKCDITFVRRIIELNKHGFTTTSCCEGHLNKIFSVNIATESSNYRSVKPYLTFDLNSIADDKKEILNAAIEKYTGIRIIPEYLEFGEITVYGYCDKPFNTVKEREHYIETARKNIYKFVDILIRFAE